MYGQGISRVGELLDLAVSLDIIKKSGAWFSYDNNRIGQGRDNAKDFLRKNPDVAEKIEKELMDNKDKLVFTRQSSKKTKTKKDDDEGDNGSSDVPERPETTPVEAPPAEEGTAPRTSEADLDVMVD